MLSDIIWNTKTRPLVLWILRNLPIKKGRIMFTSWGGRQYNCNPKLISDYIVSDSNSCIYFEQIFAFFEPEKFCGQLPQEVYSVQIGSLRYYYLLFTSQFIISNIRFAGDMFPAKRKRQYYIFTGHGGSGIKKIEFDAPSLPKEYLERAKKDTDCIDLMLSGSSFRTKCIRSAYRYTGEILESGTPRNDIFFENKVIESSEGRRYAIYTPTFRNNGRKDIYGFDFDKIIDALENRFGGTWYIRISSHPNMRDYYKEIYDFSHPRVIDIGGEDLQPYLLSSDILITDYSSAEMDFSLTKRPVFQLCRDRADYDRGFYIEPENMPFPYAENDEQLIANITNFDEAKYLRDLEIFNRDVIGLKESGHAAEAVVEWMIERK